jgi:hypothetical protein
MLKALSNQTTTSKKISKRPKQAIPKSKHKKTIKKSIRKTKLNAPKANKHFVLH